MRIDCRGAGGPPARGQKSGKQAEMPMFSITHGFRKGGDADGGAAGGCALRPLGEWDAGEGGRRKYGRGFEDCGC